MPNTDPIKCHDDCLYQVLVIQARTRLNLANCIISSMHSLLSAEKFLKDFKMPGWAPLSEEIVKKQIELSELARKKSANDLKFCAEMVEIGCKNCRDKENALYQVLQQCISENQFNYEADYIEMDSTLHTLTNL